MAYSILGFITGFGIGRSVGLDGSQAARVAILPGILGFNIASILVAKAVADREVESLPPPVSQNPEIEINLTSHNYSNVPVGQSASQTFVVRNRGAANLEVTATNLMGTDANQFSIVSGGAPFTVVAGQSHDLVVRFNPTSVSGKSANLQITSNAPGQATVNVALVGTGVAASIPIIIVTPTSRDYGNVNVNSRVSEVQPFMIGNFGGADLTVNDLRLVGRNVDQFTIITGANPVTIAPRATEIVVVRFNPNSSGPKSASLEIVSNDPNQSTINIQLSGTGVAASIPDITVDHDYSNVPLNSSASRIFVVRNRGTADLVISATPLSGANADQFALSGAALPATVNPGATLNVVVSFTPTSTGAKSASLDITSNDPDQPTINITLNGTGVAASIPDITVVPTSHDYVNVPLNSSASCIFGVKNEGTADLRISATTLSGANANQFAIVRGGAPVTVTPRGVQNVEVSFTPTSTAAKSASLDIVSNDPDQPTVNIRLSGTGVTPIP